MEDTRLQIGNKIYGCFWIQYSNRSHNNNPKIYQKQKKNLRESVSLLYQNMDEKEIK